MTAFVDSRAASRIAQEAVLLKRLLQGRAFHDDPPRPLLPSLPAGTSAGAQIDAREAWAERPDSRPQRVPARLGQGVIHFRDSGFLG
jgi:hypothetical protein